MKRIILLCLLALPLSVFSQNRRVVSTTSTPRQVLTIDSTAQQKEMQEKLDAEKQERERLNAEVERLEREKELALLREEQRKKREKEIADSLERIRVDEENSRLALEAEKMAQEQRKSEEKYAQQEEMAGIKTEVEQLKREKQVVNSPSQIFPRQINEERKQKQLQREEQRQIAPKLYVATGTYMMLNDTRFGMNIKLGYAGYYAGIRTNFKVFDAAYDITSIGNNRFVEGSDKVSRWSGFVGYNWLWSSQIGFYTGVGWGARNYYAEQDQLLKLNLNSLSIIEAECGINLSLKNGLGCSIGLSTLGFSYTDVNVCLTYKF